MTYQKAFSSVLKLLSSFQSLNIPTNRFDHKLIGIISNPREEVILTDLASIGSGFISVSLLPKEEPKELVTKFGELDLKVLFADKAGVCKILETIKSGFEVNLSKLVTFEAIEGEDIDFLAGFGIEVYFFEYLMSFEPRYLFQEPSPETLCIFSYTNGTIGRPKLVKMTHIDIMSCLTPIIFESFNITPDDVYMMYINLALFGERIMIYALSIYGVAIGFSQNMQQDLQKLQPTIMIAIPRVLDLISASIQKKVKQKSFLAQKVFNKCLNFSLKEIRHNRQVSKNLFTKVAFNEIRNSFGGRLKYILTGSSPVLKSTKEFIQACLGVEVFEAFGLVETGYSNLYGQEMMRPLIGTQVKLRYLPDVNIQGLDKKYYGEIMVKVDYFNGIWQGKEESYEKGWLATGDLVALDRKTYGFEYLERVSYCLTGASGYTLLPQRLEMIYRTSRLVAQIFVYTDRRIDGVVAVVVIDEVYLKGKWGNSILVQDLQENKVLIKDVLIDFERIAIEMKLRDYERVLDVVLEHEVWSSAELVTGSLKLRRKNLIEKYEQRIQSSIKALGALSKSI